MTGANVTKSTQKTYGFWGLVLRFINFILIMALLFSYLAQWISPQHFWPIAFFGIAYPLLAIVNTLFAIYWIIKRQRFFIYSLVSLLIGVGYFNRFYQFGSNTEYMDMNSPIKILSYNVHVFDQYHSQHGGKTIARDSIFDFLQKQNADVYCFQEFYNRENKPVQDNIKILQKKLNTPYVYKAKYTAKSKYLYLVILSKNRIQNSGTISNENQNSEISGVFADLKTNSGIVRIYNVHLTSFQISNETNIFNQDYDFASQEGQEKVKENSLRMAKKFKSAFSARAQQIQLLKTHFAESPHPIIIAGDFNDTPSSYAYGQLRSGLKDSYKENGIGFGKTYNGFYPNFRIDYILHDPKFVNYEFTTWPIPYSDHFPITATLSSQYSE